MMYGYRDTRTDRERELEYELERLRSEEGHRQEEYQRQRDERRREMQQNIEYANRTASTWPEALSKQACLFSREAGDEYDYEHYFADGEKACRRGLEIWKEVEATKQKAIAELQRQIEAIEAGIKTEVSEKLMAEAGNRVGWKSVASAIVTEDNCSRWLNW